MRHAPEIYLAPLLKSRQSFERMTEEIGNLYQAMIGTLDLLDGDPDLEDGDDREASDGDDRDCAWIEWDKMAPTMKGIQNVMGVNDEDAEDDDPKEDDCSDKAVDDDPCDPESDYGI